MKKLFTLSLLLACLIGWGQNLVPNPSFEDTVGCPKYLSIDSVAKWTSFSESPDYYNTCADSGLAASVPYTKFGYQNPATGNGFAGMICYHIAEEYREFIGCQLLSTLQIGTTYYISFKVNMAFGGPLGYGPSTIAINKLGVKCSTMMTHHMPWDNNPNFYTNNFITDTVNWITISGSFIADSAYQYLAIGNFFDDVNTNTIHLSYPLLSYYFIDDVCVSTDSAYTYNYVYTGITNLEQDISVSVFPNPFTNQLSFEVSANEPATVTLYDMLSRQVMQKTFTATTTLNTAQLATGIYIYQLQNSKGVIKKGKVVKQ